MSRSSFSFFLLIVSFGILFAGCGGTQEPEDSFEEFTFSDDELAAVHETLDDPGLEDADPVGGISEDTGEDTTVGRSPEVVTLTGSGTVTQLAPSSASALDIAPNTLKQRQYDAMRVTVVDDGKNTYRVNNPFLNVRASMDVRSDLLEKVDQGAVLEVITIPNAGWAKVRLASGKEGFVAFRYIAKLTTEEKLPTEKKKFEGQYYVDFQFLNIRREPSTQSEKVGELPGEAIVKPISMNRDWARVSYEGKEGYVSTQYLRPFEPVFLVRQDSYVLPILQFDADDTTSITQLPKHIAALKAAGKKIVTLKTLFDTVLSQETRDSRLPPQSVGLVISGVTAKNIRAAETALQTAGATATFFIETKDVGLSGITEKTLLTLLANGNDAQSGGHTGDDLRSLTDSQVMLELQQSKKIIEDITRREVYAVSYPRGGSNDRIMSKASEMGYLFGLGQAPATKFERSQFLRLPSFLISSGVMPEDTVKLVQ